MISPEEQLAIRVARLKTEYKLQKKLAALEETTRRDVLKFKKSFFEVFEAELKSIHGQKRKTREEQDDLEALLRIVRNAPHQIARSGYFRKNFLRVHNPVVLYDFPFGFQYETYEDAWPQECQGCAHSKLLSSRLVVVDKTNANVDPTEDQSLHYCDVCFAAFSFYEALFRLAWDEQTEEEEEQETYKKIKF